MFAFNNSQLNPDVGYGSAGSSLKFYGLLLNLLDRVLVLANQSRGYEVRPRGTRLLGGFHSMAAHAV